MANQRDLIAELRSWAVYSESPMPHAAQSVCVAAADEITRLRTALASARQRAMEEAAGIVEAMQNNHDLSISAPVHAYNRGKYDAAHAIRRAAEQGENTTPPGQGVA